MGQIFNRWVSLAKSLYGVVRDSFWVIPCCLLLASGCLAILNFWLDTQVSLDHRFAQLAHLNFLDIGNLRSVHSTTAAAILGVAGVSFSITIASLTLASQQFGPRLIRTFIRDRFIQTTLGLFVATFFYCMIMMQLSSAFTNNTYLPVFSLLTVLILTFVDLVFLVLFIHHICVSIQVDSVIDEVVTETNQRTEILLEKECDDSRHEAPKPHLVEEFRRKFEDEPTLLKSTESGYITYIDYESLCERAEEQQVFLNIKHRAGDYVMRGSVLIESCATDQDDTSLQCMLDAVIISRIRTPAQDLEYTINQLVEIALRALSPGINDPFTAIICIDHLGSVINLVGSKTIPSIAVYDSSDNIRLMRDQTTYEGLVESAFNQIRQAAVDRVDVTIRLLEIFNQLLTLCRNDEQASALAHQAELVIEGMDRSGFLKHDVDAIQERIENFRSLKDQLNH